MQKLLIRGGKQLCGKVNINCAKNAYLPILASTILCEDKVVLKNCPKFLDIENMIAILQNLGMKIAKDNNDLCIDGKDAKSFFIPTDLAKTLRSSIFTLGALLSRFKKAKVAYPGGCDIGLRPIDLHLKGLACLGVKITDFHGYINCDATNMHGGVVHLDFPSVGATENLMLASVLNKGETVVVNCAKEPEIVDLQNFLNMMGANVKGAGTDVIQIIGVKNLRGATWQPIPDRIIAGTYMIATAIAGGEVELHNCNPNHFKLVTDKLIKSGCKIVEYNDKIKIVSSGKLHSCGVLQTQPYPGFPTDLQAQMLALQTVCEGNCIVEENLFESRFKFVPELIKMGAKVKVDRQTAFVVGTDNLYGADVYATDLRGGAALIVAGLRAKGYTTVHDIYHIDRGYDKIESTLKSLGADIERID